MRGRHQHLQQQQHTEAYSETSAVNTCSCAADHCTHAPKLDRVVEASPRAAGSSTGVIMLVVIGAWVHGIGECDWAMHDTGVIRPAITQRCGA
jgi:hypothetical protein